MSGETAPPGWYAENGRERYWDGNAWTDRVRSGDQQPSEERYAINPVGTGLVLLGCLAIAVSLFLPFVSTASFPAGIKDNSVIQSLTGIGIRYLVVAILIAASAYRSHQSGTRSWGPIVGGVIMLVFVFADSANDDNFKLVSLSGFGPSGSVVGDPGLAFYVAGVGGLLSVIGGFMMRSSNEAAAPAQAATPTAAQTDTQAATKKCPDCAETILADARVCRHCGYRFDAGTNDGSSAPGVPAGSPP